MANKSSNNLVVPNAREAMDKFKMEAANEVGVNLKNGYNGDITARQAGSVGGQMVKNIWPRVEKTFVRKLRSTGRHEFAVTYFVGIGIG